MISGKPVGEIAAAIIDYRGKTPPKSPGGIKLLTAKVIKAGTIDDSRLEYVSEETYSWWMRRGLPQQWDVLLTTEAPLGETAMLRTPERIALAQRVILLRGDPEQIDQHYLFAALRSPLVQGRLRQRATGTTVVGIKQRELRQVEIPLPPLPTQRKIAAILSAYDDLIENNNRRIKILEEMAQRIYREWFVDFHYPGHENVPSVDSEVGAIPDGWVVEAVGELGRLVTGVTPSSREPALWGDEQAFITPSDLSYGRTWVAPARRLSELGARRLASRSLPAGAVCFTCIASIGKMCVTHEPSVTNQQINSVIPREDRVNADFLFHKLRAETPLIQRTASGTATPIISKSSFGAIKLGWPPLALQDVYGQHAHRLHGMISTLERASATLRATRDLLLPRLISGEIDAGDLDVTMRDAA